MAKSCFLIVNPTSGRYSPATPGRLLALAAARGLEPELLPTAGPRDASLFAARICRETREPLILAAGGDGTVNGVLNGLEPGVATLGVIPLGTSNVLARELGIVSLEDALDRVACGRTRSFAVGEAECGGEKRRFGLMAGVGLDGAVVRGVRLSEKRAVGKAAYLLSALRLLFAWDRGLLRVTGGGRTLSCHSVIVCRAARYGGDFLLAPEADLFTPSFQAVCIKGGRRLDYLKLCLRLASGRFAASPLVETFAAGELEVSGTKAIQLDGDFLGLAPLRLRIVPDLARLIV